MSGVGIHNSGKFPSSAGSYRGENAMMPVVSVIIPVRNGERTLARAIDSARGQTFTDGVEVIVVDNGSTDRTCDAIRRYGDRIIALYEPIPGPARARNVAIFVARGEYLAFLDADDEWMPEKLARIIPLLEGDPECVLAYHDAIEIDTAGNIIKKSYYPVGHNSAPSLADLLSGRYPGNPILPTNVVMRRAVAIRVGGFVEEMSALEDVGMWFLVREHGPFRFRAEALARREWEPSVRREDWYIKGGYALYRMLVSRYGRQIADANLIPFLVWEGTMAMLRGDRALARKRYFASLRLRPTRGKTWIRLCTTLLPRRIIESYERRRRERLYGAADRTITVAATSGRRR